VNDKKEVIKSYGDTKKYLLPLHFNSYLTELLPKPLAVAFSTLSITALKTNKKTSLSGIKIKSGGVIIKVNMTVKPLSIKKGERLLVVTFTEDTLFNPTPQEALVFNEKIYQDQYTVNLEEELNELKDKLLTTVEQLDASNENMQSFNEELLSANEEMQSTNEEMQSVNEELDTINADYQLKNKELLEINDDLNNYFRSNLNAQLFINNDLLLMKFSPATVNLINLLDSDIGRPISNISTNIKFETIIDDIQQVLIKGSVIAKEVETNNGKWYQMRAMPYVHQADNKNSGAIITFNDITEIKKTQQELDQKNKSLLRINADLDNFVLAASHDLLGPLGNIETSISVMNTITLSEPKLFDFINMINTSIKAFRFLITDLATIAKVEGDMIAMENVDINDIINNVEWSLEKKIQESGATIVRDIKSEQIFFSKKNLRSVVYNLISNAIKFKRDEPPVIKIATGRDGKNTILTVEDNGQGIPKKSLDKIFEMYGRLHQDIEGSGIGLYLAKKIINAASGSIVVESEPGKGTKFIIHFMAEMEPIVAASLN